jgi:molybdenum cofactor guanylyltransferase
MAAVAHDGERRQPLFGLYHRTALHSAEQAAQADWPVWRWQDSIAAREVDFRDCASRFRNLNVPADFESTGDANHD